MLVLTRKVDERIAIGREITVTVVAILGNKVRLGIDAPPEIPIHRTELGDDRREGEDGLAAILPGLRHFGFSILDFGLGESDG